MKNIFLFYIHFKWLCQNTLRALGRQVLLPDMICKSRNAIDIPRKLSLTGIKILISLLFKFRKGPESSQNWLIISRYSEY
jgi:hypothetical protein